MAMRKKPTKERPAQRPARVKLTAEESLKRMAEFERRKEHFIPSSRKGKD